MKRLLTVFIAVSMVVGLTAQVPETMSYQAVIRNSNNQLVINQAIGLRISILQGTSTGEIVYRETYNPDPKTNANGLVTVEIGGGIPNIGTFSIIDWSAGPYFLNTETDPTGGTNYTITGTSQILSVPYALYAKTAENGFSGNYNDLTNQPPFAPVATSGNYSDLNGLPALFHGNYDSLFNKPTLFSGDYNDLTNLPGFAPVATSGNYSDLNGLPVLFDGNYDSLFNKPTLFNGTWSSLTGKPTTLTGYGITDAVNITGNQTIVGNKTFTGTISAGNHPIINVAEPVNLHDAATKAYVDQLKAMLEDLTERVSALEANNGNPATWEGKIMTVNGLVPADSMGITLQHEHLLIWHTYMEESNLVSEEDAISELQYFADAGGKTLTEVTNIGIRRDPEGIKRISNATGVNVIMGTGFYKNNWIPDSFKNKSVEELAEIIINDIKYGINGIHAGIIGEIGVSRPITSFEEKVLRAAARAQKATGASIDVHFDRDGDISERHYALDILESEGADLTRVCVAHNTPYIERLDDFITYAQRGCFFAFDMLGHEVIVWFAGELNIGGSVKALIDLGYIDNIILSQDVCFTECYVKNGGYGYAHIINDVIPELKTAGVTDEQIHAILVENPKRLLAFKDYSKN